jgi:hypothetical protein
MSVVGRSTRPTRRMPSGTSGAPGSGMAARKSRKVAELGRTIGTAGERRGPARAENPPAPAWSPGVAPQPVPVGQPGRACREETVAVTPGQDTPKAIGIETAEAASLADTLDGLSAGVFLLAAGERIVHANTAGHAMLAEGDFLRARGPARGRRASGRSAVARGGCHRCERPRGGRQGHCDATDGAPRRALRSAHGEAAANPAPTMENAPRFGTIERRRKKGRASARDRPAPVPVPN